MKIQITKSQWLALFLASVSALITDARIRTEMYSIGGDSEHPTVSYAGNLDYNFVADHNFAVRTQQMVCGSQGVMPNNQLYCLTYPDTVCNGQEFSIVLTITNNASITVPGPVPFADVVPDPTQGPTFAPGLAFVSNTTPPTGTFDPTGPTLLGLGGKGAWFNFTLLANQTITMTMVIQATALGLQQYTAAIQGNPAIPVGPLLINVITPIAATNETISTCQNTPVSGSVGPLVTGGSGNYNFLLVGAEVGGTVTFFDATTGNFTFTPTAGFSGAGSFQFIAADLSTGCATPVAGTVTINVNVCCSLTASSTAVNDCLNAPVIGNLANLITGGTGPFTFGPLGAPIGGGVTIAPSGPFTFTPTLGFSGIGGFSYQVADSFACTATAMVGITISSPIADSDSFVDCDSISFTGDVSSLVTSGFPPYTFSLSGAPVGGVATVSPSGIFSFTPNPAFNGPGGFVYLVTDTNGCTGTGAINVALGSPIVSATAISTCNNSFSGNLNSFVTGGTPPLTFTGPIGSVSCPGASVTINANGTFNYTAPTGLTGPCSFVYGVTDSNTCDNTGSLTITANVIPVAQSASYSACKNIPITQTLQVTGGVPPITFSVITAPANGSLLLDSSTGVFTYTPDAGFVGTDSFIYQVTDSSTPTCNSNTATISLVINNCCPVITDPFWLLYLQIYG